MKINITSLSLLAALCGVLFGVKINKNTMGAPEADSDYSASVYATPVELQTDIENFDEDISDSIFEIKSHLNTTPTSTKLLHSTNEGNLLSFDMPSQDNGMTFNW